MLFWRAKYKVAGTFLAHEIRSIYGKKVFQNSSNVFRFGGNKFYDQKNRISIKILAEKRAKIGIIAEFCKILSRFPNQGQQPMRVELSSFA
jgi:hypothetical protein